MVVLQALRDKLRAQLVLHEGLRLKPYVDTAGKITIGVGRNLTDVGISVDEADALLDHDLDIAIADMASFPWFTRLDAIRQRAIVDFRFNVGPKTFRTFKKLIAALASADYPKASNELRASKWFKQVKSRGPHLVDMLRTGEDFL